MHQAAGSLAPVPVFAALQTPKTGGVVRVEIGGAVVEIEPRADMVVVHSVLHMFADSC